MKIKKILILQGHGWSHTTDLHKSLRTHSIGILFPPWQADFITSTHISSFLHSLLCSGSRKVTFEIHYETGSTSVHKCERACRIETNPNECPIRAKNGLFGTCLGSKWGNIPDLFILSREAKYKSSSVQLRTYFSLKYRLQTDSVRLFKECSPHKRMLFTSPRLHIHINISLISTCLIRVRIAFAFALHSHSHCIRVQMSTRLDWFLNASHIYMFSFF